jgi:2-polyprenyl-6-methoxyphenol hydroxylase-like FAD-dependent oxidoreductase
MAREHVLIAGAGPTGLLLALWLARLGVRVRIIDKTSEPGTTSRALAVQGRTLEFYRQLGIADHVIGSGLEMNKANLWSRGRRVAHIEFGRLGPIPTPYPFGVIYPQDEHERFLIDRLHELNVHVERETELIDFQGLGDGVRARTNRGEVDAAFLAGCDGAHSTIRQQLGIGFGGGTYEHLFYVADVEASGQQVDQELHVSIDTSDFLAVFPLKEKGRVRLIGTIRREAEEGKELEWTDVSQDILRRLRIDVRRVNWFSTYRVHHRVASRFRAGRAFLLGDAAHIHSPVGGQGMNTGIGDAVNLAWKLASVIHDRAPMSLLDTFEPERIAFARRLVATTDRTFQFVTRSGPLAAFVRAYVAPRVIGAAFRILAVRRFMFRTVSQISIEYRDSALSDGRAGKIHGGDRLPWVREPDNFAPLRSLDWQVHVYGDDTQRLRASCKSLGLALHVFPWSVEAERAGLARNASYLIRPDGYVAIADRHQSAPNLERYLDSHHLRS